MKSKTGRNDPCPCGNVNKYKNCCMTRNNQKLPATWTDQEGANVIAKAEKPTTSEIEQMTKEYQNQLRNS